MDYRIENIESTKVIGAYRHYKSGGHAQSTFLGRCAYYEIRTKSDNQLNGLLGVCLPKE